MNFNNVLQKKNEKELGSTSTRLRERGELASKHLRIVKQVRQRTTTVENDKF